MKLHPNARTTPSGRWLLVKRVREQHWTVSEAAEAAGVSLRTAYKWLARYRDEGCVGLADARGPDGSRDERRPASCEGASKKLARIRGVGHRIHGDRSKRVYGTGWEFAHVCIDDHTRLAYVEVLSDERPTTTTAFLRPALAWYRARGIGVERFLSRP